MKRKVLFIHSAGSQRFSQGSSDLLAYLQDKLGLDYDLLSPQMPTPENPEYERWKAVIKKELAKMDEAILIGHSLGGTVLLKYLFEELCHTSISGVFLIAAPYWNKDDDWQGDEFAFSEDIAEKLPHKLPIFLYHSRDEEIVPFTHLKYYKEKLPEATIREIHGAEHYFNDGLPQLVDDILDISSPSDG